MSTPERPSFASPCDLDELKHQVREKAIAELKEYIEKDGAWEHTSGFLQSIPDRFRFSIHHSDASSVAQDADVYGLSYKGKIVYKVVLVSSVDAEEQKQRAKAQRQYTAEMKKASCQDRYRWERRMPYSWIISNPTPEDAHSKWFVSLWDELHKKIVQAKECKEWEALLHDKPKKEEALGSLVEYSSSKSSEVDTPMWVILGGLCLLTIIIGAILL